MTPSGFDSGLLITLLDTLNNTECEGIIQTAETNDTLLKHRNNLEVYPQNRGENFY